MCCCVKCALRRSSLEFTLSISPPSPSLLSLMFRCNIAFSVILPVPLPLPVALPLTLPSTLPPSYLPILPLYFPLTPTSPLSPSLSAVSGRSLLWCYPLSGMADSGNPKLIATIVAACKTSAVKEVEVHTTHTTAHYTQYCNSKMQPNIQQHDYALRLAVQCSSLLLLLLYPFLFSHIFDFGLLLPFSLLAFSLPI